MNERDTREDYIRYSQYQQANPHALHPQASSQASEIALALQCRAFEEQKCVLPVLLVDYLEALVGIAASGVMFLGYQTLGEEIALSMSNGSRKATVDSLQKGTMAYTRSENKTRRTIEMEKIYSTTNRLVTQPTGIPESGVYLVTRRNEKRSAGNTQSLGIKIQFVYDSDPYCGCIDCDDMFCSRCCASLDFWIVLFLYLHKNAYHCHRCLVLGAGGFRACSSSRKMVPI